ncbi:filamentous hemagglutinin N-terminal domain-containing protein [Leptolyngbya sp. GGD]|uniref:filamentous hemagglutinin N-terminal domain-containing protein n=1 Tax=Leptolyngbya sp. GGD TaxID=2997907 RepID=UPI00227BEED5|nr:filamentous hemagglutinin N-terminal domain-containing protein [Leptolyngbya sp. GGD]MCY6493875.1 filamentous hemagglutinin N-terminal domain-containing protein [Leptolyngbya sp. GGD]
MFRINVLGNLLGVCLLLFPSYVLAQITPDTSLDRESSRLTQIGKDGTVQIDGGAQRGGHLFHSFRDFNVGEGKQVYFANPVGVETIFSRVTGSEVSRILRRLGVQGKANLFLLNPNGIIFGKDAQLDIKGSFVASAGGRFIFPDGSEYSAIDPQAPPLLTITTPIGLQQLTNLSGTISNAGQLAVGQDLTLVGRQLDLQGQLQAGRNVTLQAQETLKVRDSVTAPFLATAGGNMVIRGDRGVDIFALSHPRSGFFSGKDMILRSSSAVGGDARFWSGGNFRIEQLDQSLGDLFSPFDPVILSSGDVSFNN